MQFFRTLTAAGLIAAAATAPVAAAEISGAGSSFAYPIYAKWIEAYKKETGVAVDYRSIGSADIVFVISIIYFSRKEPLSADCI